MVWKSVDAADPAVIGAPVQVTGWKAHPTIKGAFVAPLPPNITKGSTLRHFWVDGQRGARPTKYACSLKNGKNVCNAANSSVPKATFPFTLAGNSTMYPKGSWYDVAAGAGVGVGDPSSWFVKSRAMNVSVGSFVEFVSWSHTYAPSGCIVRADKQTKPNSPPLMHD